MKILSSGSIVLYEHSYDEISTVIDCLFRFAESNFTLYLVDNSVKDSLRELQKISDKLIYIHNPLNPGFGASHNVALRKAMNYGSDFHFIINPDVSFDVDVLNPLMSYMEENDDVGMMMPQILNVDGTVQNLPKLLPSPFSVLMRKLKKPTFYYKKFIKNYELRFVPSNVIYNAPILSGCFTLLKISAIKEIGMYDDRFFMYFEDWDLSRRMHQKYKTIYFPDVSVTHGYESGASKNARLFKIFLNSAYNYFNKWGWFDAERNEINKKAILQFK